MYSFISLPAGIRKINVFKLRTLWKEILAGSREGTPWKMDGWNTKMEVWKMMFLFSGVIFGFYVNFPGCNGSRLLVDGTFLAIEHLV